MNRLAPRIGLALFVILISFAVADQLRHPPTLPAEASVGTPAPPTTALTPIPTPVATRSRHTSTPSRTPTTAAASPSVRNPDAPSPTPTFVPVATPAPLAADRLAAAIDPLVANVPAHLGVVVALPDGTILYQHNADTQFEAASLYKLAVMVEIYRQREAGELTFDQLVTLSPGFFYEDDPIYGDADVGTQVPLDELLTNMITVSSNVAAEALLYTVGSDRVNATLAALGLASTEIRWSPQAAAPAARPRRPGAALPATLRLPGGGERAPAEASDAYAVTSPADIERLFQLLLAGKVVSQRASQEMLDLLGKQTINDRLPAGLPDSVRVAHKTGNLDDAIHDAGVIYAPKGPVIVVAMSDQIDNQDAVVAFMQELGQLAYSIRE
ncbi:MAG TPA: serine hydrolase [Thermomicrobiaceae bacterium]|nr:serine hydrolase [Thermomicrobiaceae bacterium]